MTSEETRPEPGRDQDLLRRFHAHDPAVCRQLEQWAQQIARVRHLWVPPADRDDIVQESLVQIWICTSADGFVLRGSLRALVRKVTAARCIDRLRRARPMLELDPRRAGPSDDPLAIVVRQEERMLLHWALRQLTPLCQQIISLRIYRELPYSEIAAMLERSEPTIRVHVFNSIKAIRDLLGKRSATTLKEPGQGTRRPAALR